MSLLLALPGYRSGLAGRVHPHAGRPFQSRAINLTHSTSAHRRPDFVGTNHRTWSEGHDWRGLYSVKRHVTLAGFSGCEGKPGVHGGKARGCESKPADFSGYVRSPLVWGHQHAVPEITHRPVAYRIIVC